VNVHVQDMTVDHDSLVFSNQNGAMSELLLVS
jgi:hypothetical protein